MQENVDSVDRRLQTDIGGLVVFGNNVLEGDAALFAVIDAAVELTEEEQALDGVPTDEEHRAELLVPAAVVRAHGGVDLVRIPLPEREVIATASDLRLLGLVLHLLCSHSHADAGRVHPTDSSGADTRRKLSIFISERLSLEILRLVV